VTVRELRARQGFTQEALADEAGYSRGFIKELESGRRRPSFEAVARVAAALGVDLEELVRLYQDRLRESPRSSSG